MVNQKGFTLVELLIVIAIVAILAVVAVPNFNETMQRNRMVANANEILSAIQYARAEALRQGGRVFLAPVDGTNWPNGLVVYLDADDDDMLDTGEEIRVWQALASGSALSAVAGATAIEFDSRGFAAANGTGTPPSDTEEAFKLCDNRDDETGRYINLLISGSAWIGDADDCNGP
ncbi:GspH/FimT family pseudopilin [Halioxenophilus aromaticivorans]|uniref:Type II secretion system protein H n=1 Tax=Halioxenophilus aromaticivorans TaxID=1306992 RepID=A0AAV3TY72_9ALTE